MAAAALLPLGGMLWPAAALAAAEAAADAAAYNPAGGEETLKTFAGQSAVEAAGGRAGTTTSIAGMLRNHTALLQPALPPLRCAGVAYIGLVVFYFFRLFRKRAQQATSEVRWAKWSWQLVVCAAAIFDPAQACCRASARALATPAIGTAAPPQPALSPLLPQRIASVADAAAPGGAADNSDSEDEEEAKAKAAVAAQEVTPLQTVM